MTVVRREALRRFSFWRTLVACAVLGVAVGTGSAVAQAPAFALRFSGTLLLAPPSSATPGQRVYACGRGSSCHPAPSGTLITAVTGNNIAALLVCGYAQVSDGQGHFQLDVPMSAATTCVTNGYPLSSHCASRTVGFLFVVNGETAGGVCAPQQLGALGQVSLAVTDLPPLQPPGTDYVTLPVVRFIGTAGVLGSSGLALLTYDRRANLPPAPQGTVLDAYVDYNQPGCTNYYQPGCSGLAYCGSGQVYDNVGDYEVDAEPLSSACGAGTYQLMAETGYYGGAGLCVSFDPTDGATWGHPLPGGVDLTPGQDPNAGPNPPPPAGIPPQPWPTQPVPAPAQPVPPPSQPVPPPAQGGPSQPQPPAVPPGDGPPAGEQPAPATPSPSTPNIPLRKRVNVQSNDANFVKNVSHCLDVFENTPGLEGLMQLLNSDQRPGEAAARAVYIGQWTNPNGNETWPASAINPMNPQNGYLAAPYDYELDNPGFKRVVTDPFSNEMYWGAGPGDDVVIQINPGLTLAQAEREDATQFAIPNPDADPARTADPLASGLCLGLLHELAHAYDIINGTDDWTPVNGVKQSESNAVSWENLYRRWNWTTLRTTYGGVMLPAQAIMPWLAPPAGN